jgi:hypothetical protein
MISENSWAEITTMVEQPMLIYPSLAPRIEWH